MSQSYQVTLADGTRYRVTLPADQPEGPSTQVESPTATPPAADSTIPTTSEEAPSSLTDKLLGIPEALLSLGSGMVTYPILKPVAGLAGAASLVAGKSAEQATQNIKTVEQAGTYEPRTKTGQMIVGGVGKLLSLPGKAFEAVGESTKSSLAQSIVEGGGELGMTALMYLPLMASIPFLAKYMPAKTGKLMTGDVNVLEAIAKRERTTIQELAEGKSIIKPTGVSEAPQAYVISKEGNTYTGNNHAEAYIKLEDAGDMPAQVRNSGWVVNGRYVRDSEASNAAEAAKIGEVPPAWTGKVSESGREISGLTGLSPEERVKILDGQVAFKLEKNGNLAPWIGGNPSDATLEKGEATLWVKLGSHEANIAKNETGLTDAQLRQKVAPQLFGYGKYKQSAIEEEIRNKAQPFVTPIKPELKIGDLVNPVSAQGELLSANPVKITDIQEMGGKKYYQVEGSKTYMPEGQVERVAAQPRVSPADKLANRDPNFIPSAINLKEKDLGLWKQASDRAKLQRSEPPPTEFITPSGKASVTSKSGLADSLSTPLSGASRRGNLAEVEGYVELNLTEKHMRDAEALWNAKDAKGLSGLTQKEGIQVAQAYRGRTLDEALKVLPAKLQQALVYSAGKFEDMKGILQTHMRDLIRPQVRKEIERAIGPAFEALGVNAEAGFIEWNIGKRVDGLVHKRIPDSWGINDYLSQMTIGDYLITEKKTGSILSASRTPIQRKLAIRELTQDGKFTLDDLAFSERVHIDSDMFSAGRGRSALKIAEEMAGNLKLTPEEAARAAEGDFSFKSKTPFMPFILERKGKSSAYTNDLLLIHKMYNRATARWIALGPLAKKLAPVIEGLEAKGFSVEANNLKANLDILWGKRNDLSKRFDNTIQATPIIGQLVAPYALERWAGGLKQAMVATMIKYSPRFHLVNSTQLFNTLWPIAGSDEIYAGIKMFGSKAGKEILNRYSIEGASRVGTGLGPIEDFNQGAAFLTMYNRAVKLGLDSNAAADYAFLRGNVYSQFHALQTDRPALFRKLDPTGVLTLFQRFTVKQIEQFADLVKDRNVSGAAKWLATIGLMGGWRGLTMGSAGWLTHRMYQDISDQYGETVANALHLGLPSFAGVDLSNTAMLYNPPMGKSVFEKVGYAAAGPLGSISSSVLGAMFNTKGVDPSAAHRGFNALVQRLPVAKELESVRRIIMDDYNLTDPAGKLKYTADVKDMIRMSLGFRTVTEAKLQQLADAITQARQKREEVVDYAASRYGQAIITGIGLPQPMETAIQKDVDGWNARWPEMSIIQDDIMVRARARAEQGMVNLRQRLLKSSGKVGKASEFQG